MYHTSYGSVQERAGYEDPPLPTEYDFRRRSGDHPPKKPISYYEWSLMQQHRMVKEEYENRNHPSAKNLPESVRQKILDTNEAVLRALRDSEIPGGWNSYHECLRAQKGTSVGWKFKFKTMCEGWQSQITIAQANLEGALLEASPYQEVSERGSTSGGSMAEVTAAAKDQGVTAIEQGRLVMSDPECDWWCQAKNTNPWLNTLLIWGIIGGVGLIGARVLLPPLFGTYLASRRPPAAPPAVPPVAPPAGTAARW